MVKHILLVLAAGTLISSAVPVVSISGGSASTPYRDYCYGWQFTANEHIIVTHLGLYDAQQDGFNKPHQIGLFKIGKDKPLVLSEIQSGTANVLKNKFRYVDTPDVILEPGVQYTIAYYCSSEENPDHHIRKTAKPQAHRVITMGKSVWTAMSGELILPEEVGAYYMIGPNFMYKTTFGEQKTEPEKKPLPSDFLNRQ